MKGSLEQLDGIKEDLRKLLDLSAYRCMIARIEDMRERAKDEAYERGYMAGYSFAKSNPTYDE
ncbi:MAG: hypothetical protein ACI4CX_00040 [Candidatus Weimeria sp.]